MKARQEITYLFLHVLLVVIEYTARENITIKEMKNMPKIIFPVELKASSVKH